jgi:hypothetical protein
MRFLCGTAREIKQVLRLVVADPRVKAVLKGKNRFKVKTPNGFCDLLLHVLLCVEIDGTSVEHICNSTSDFDQMGLFEEIDTICVCIVKA